MKGLRFAALLLVLVCLTACTPQTTAPPTTIAIAEETMAPTTTEAPATTQPIPVTPKPAMGDYQWDERYAITPKYYIIAPRGQRGTRIWRLPRNEIDKPVELLPRLRDAKGSPVLFPMICGVTDQWLYLNAEVRGREFGDTDKVIMRLNIATGKLENLREGNWMEGYGWYNAGSDSILYYTCNPHSEGDNQRIEALDLDTRKRSMIFDEPGYMTNSYNYWYNLTDGRLALQERCYSGSSLYAMVDAENKAAPAERKDLPLDLPWEPKPRNEAEATLANAGAVCYTTIGNMVFWVEEKEEGDALWRMNRDGTDKKLLRTDTDIRALQGVGGCLFAKVFLRQDWINGAGEYNVISIRWLGFDGKTVGTITEAMEQAWGSPKDPPDETVFMEDFGGKLLVACKGNIYSEFIALYDPKTGNAFLDENYY